MSALYLRVLWERYRNLWSASAEPAWSIPQLHLPNAGFWSGRGIKCARGALPKTPVYSKHR